MSQRIKNIVQFTGITPNVATSLPHGLVTSNGRPLTPDVTTPSIGGFTITADDTNVTVTGNGTAVNVLCEAWHTIERSFGDVNDEDLVPQPFIPFGGGTDSAQVFDNLVFRPGGVAGANVYTTWPALYAALQTIQGKKTIQFDDSISSPCVIPAGSWDMRDVEWIGARPPNDGQAQVNISDGCSLPNLFQLGSDLFITNLNTVTSPVVIGANAVTIEIGFSPSGAYCILNNPLGSVPFFDLSAGGFAFFRVQGRFQGTVPMVTFGAAAPLFGNNAGIILLDNAQIRSNMFTGTNAAQKLEVIYAGTTAQFGNISTTVFAGTVFEPVPAEGFGSPGFLRQWYSPQPPLPPSTVPLTPANGNGMGTLLRLNTTAGDIAQVLPKIRSNSATVGVTPQSVAGITDGVAKSLGMPVTVKNELGANNVNVTPDPATPDTIEGGAGPIVIPPGGSRTFVADGVSNWMIVAAYL